eukprot:CAMPEP_0172943702 /NCGR_PEP_ID=MMETSP1075-20121228/225679_1 /TAXON_ID=2916 /ORGANISM="Ceratium fusus, Strain PA161109" /LENGTH=79 /DNA_ID=CAMNT_0013805129 /DNA_START=799 /DNA_END=1038 /DNA_ORIENTATION=+
MTRSNPLDVPPAARCLEDGRLLREAAETIGTCPVRATPLIDTSGVTRLLSATGGVFCAVVGSSGLLLATTCKPRLDIFG